MSDCDVVGLIVIAFVLSPAIWLAWIVLDAVFCQLRKCLAAPPSEGEVEG